MPAIIEEMPSNGDVNSPLKADSSDSTKLIVTSTNDSTSQNFKTSKSFFDDRLPKFASFAYKKKPH